MLNRLSVCAGRVPQPNDLMSITYLALLTVGGQQISIFYAGGCRLMGCRGAQEDGNACAVTD